MPASCSSCSSSVANRCCRRAGRVCVFRCLGLENRAAGQGDRNAEEVDADRAVLAPQQRQGRRRRTRSVWIPPSIQPRPDGGGADADLEDLLARPAAQRPDFRRYLRDADPVVATNAAIAVAREAAGNGSEVPLQATQGRPFRADKDGLERPSYNRGSNRPQTVQRADGGRSRADSRCRCVQRPSKP